MALFAEKRASRPILIAGRARNLKAVSLTAWQLRIIWHRYRAPSIDEDRSGDDKNAEKAFSISCRQIVFAEPGSNEDLVA